MLSRWLRGAAAVVAAYILFFHGLSETGLLGPDEPRYASIGREMAQSGDWVTPRLWGEPWFEKPALTYWMTAVGFRAGLGEELAPRLPVALLSLAFLVFYGLRLRREFGGAAAWYATLMLTASAGWLAFSQLGVTDLPMSACFAAAMLVALEWARSGERRLAVAAGALLGLAVLAKGLVPLVLAAPLVWAGRKRLPGLALVFGMAVATAAPWYVLCTWRNGAAFLEEFFWRHHFERFASESLQHVQPFWFYVPVLAAAVLPWTPVAGRLFRRNVYRDPGARFLAAWAGFGFVVFSLSTNKLPGYLLPLLPAVCALMGLTLARAERARWTMAACGLLVVAYPAAAEVLPAAVRSGLWRARFSGVPWVAMAGCVILAAAAWLLETRGRRRVAVELLTAGIVVGVLYLKVTTLGSLDRTASARALWREIEPVHAEVCLEPIHRAWQYGLHYYSLRPLPSCTDVSRPLHVRQTPGEPAYLAR